MEEILGRIKTAIEFLKDGLPFKVGDLYLGKDENDYIYISADSQCIDLKNMTKQRAITELEEIKSVFGKMVSTSIELKDFIHNKRFEFSLDFNYGMGTIRICSEIDGIIKWKVELK